MYEDLILSRYIKKMIRFLDNQKNWAVFVSLDCKDCLLLEKESCVFSK